MNVHACGCLVYLYVNLGIRWWYHVLAHTACFGNNEFIVESAQGKGSHYHSVLKCKLAGIYA